MKIPITRAVISRWRHSGLMPAFLAVACFSFCLMGGVAWASDGITAAGDVLQFVLPATAAGLTLGYRDGQGVLQFGESVVLTLGVTYGLKYSVNEKRPNGGSQSCV